jgi:nucleoside-diphosphate-sugar epimerase
MNDIFLTGSSGFVGKNLQSYFNNKYKIVTYNRKLKFIDTNSNIFIHLAGKAHDLKYTANPKEYYQINTDFTKEVFDKFINSNASIFITLSSVKAAADKLDIPLTEEYIPRPETHYGKSKLFAEEYILSKEIPSNKRVYILRPCMIHGPGNKGNLNLLYKIVSKGIPWPLGNYENKRSFCYIDNLCFIIDEIINNNQIASGIYNIADDEPVSTNDLIRLISESQAKKPFILNIPKFIVNFLSKLGNKFKLPLNTERLNKLTENYIVSNNKIAQAIKKPLPVSSKEGLKKTLNSFKNR